MPSLRDVTVKEGEEPLAKAVLGPSGHTESCTPDGKGSAYCVYMHARACTCVQGCAHRGLDHVGITAEESSAPGLPTDSPSHTYSAPVAL